HIFRQEFALFRSPIDEPTSVLDLKCGSGYWADKIALVTSAHVLGLDIAPVQHSTAPNCRFLLDSINSEWRTAPASFDLIRGSKLLGNIQDWAGLLRNSLHCLSPGGYIELCDTPFKYTSEGNAIPTWKSVSQRAHELGKKIGSSFFLTPGTYVQHMAAAGFVDVHE
ncbi:S-adenosyl-L-methionine-dependent methyltransferase, partial [Chaetomium tenue]